MKRYEQDSGNKVVVKIASKTGRTSTNDPDGHGSCVWAHAVSPVFGVVKKAKTVIVTCDDSIIQPNSNDFNSMTDALNIIAHDVKAAKLGPKATINISSVGE